MQTQTDDFVPMNPADWIEPGTETMSQRLEACRDLAACVEAASAELDAIWGPEGAEEFLPNYAVKRPNASGSTNEMQAMDRLSNAQDALSREIEEMNEDGAMDLLIQGTSHAAFVEILADVTADATGNATDLMDTIR